MKLIEINNLTKQLPRIFSINLTLKKMNELSIKFDKIHVK